MIPLLPFLAMALVLIAPSAARSAGDVDPIALRNGDHGRLTVPVRIGTMGPFHFLIDTAAQHSAASDKQARGS
jgi:hypothetical protein